MSESSEIEVMLGFLFKNICAERRFALKMLRGLFGVDCTAESSVKLTERLIDFFTELIIFVFLVLSSLFLATFRWRPVINAIRTLERHPQVAREEMNDL